MIHGPLGWQWSRARTRKQRLEAFAISEWLRVLCVTRPEDHPELDEVRAQLGLATIPAQ